MINLIEVLKEQASFGFTGKINILLRNNSQFIGVIYQEEGLLVGAESRELKGKKALLKLIFEDVESHDLYKFVVEPELVSPDLHSMKVTIDEVKTEAQVHFQDYINAKKLKPSPDLRLVLNPEILISNEDLTPREFDVMSVITEWCKVSDIYKYSKLMDFEITNALVSLRKKRAIKVFQN
ncbi:MAG: hypothetical protein HOP07_09490 [Bacteriovoracaceae bacterium]|nr:hypothetical protein [Bacteriovoracaceae bacterium]